MKKHPLLLISLFAIILFQSCINPNCITGIGSIENDKREVGEFDEIELKTDFDVIIKERVMGDNNKLEVRAQNNLLPYIKTTVEGGRLIIDTEGCVQATSPIEIFVKVNEISAVKLTGSGEITSKNTLHSDNMALSCDGSGSINLRIKAENITLANSASGLIKVDGNATKAAVSLAGSGEIDAESLKSDEADVVLSGSGSIKVHATKKIVLNHSGSGNITYSGNPDQKTELTSGSGSIIRRD
jgi:Putative auto-transporter adhesin, head GIN domain